MKIKILDYGMGNHMSVIKAIKYLGYDCEIIDDLNLTKNVDFLILPGVGSYDKAIKNLEKSKNINSIKELALKKKIPILGICLGMQLFSTTGTEGILTNGLNLIPGDVKKINTDSQHLPHIGWNNVSVQNNDFLNYNNIDFYFIHSYSYNVFNKKHILMTHKVNDIECVSAIRKDNIIGFQFHPEKSQDYGLDLLKYVLKC